MIKNLKYTLLLSMLICLVTACDAKEKNADLSYEDVQRKNAEAQQLISDRENALLAQFKEDDQAAKAKPKKKKRKQKSNSNYGIGNYKIIAKERSIYMSTAAGNLLVTSDEAGELQQTQDYGKTWQAIENPLGELPTFMQFTADGEHAVFISQDGKILSNMNDAKQYTTFDLHKNAPKLYTTDYGQELNTINFSADLKNGQLVAWCNIWQTRDGGQTWQIAGENLLNNNSDHCFEKAYVNAEYELTFALMYINTGYGTNKLYQTNDQGQSWENVCPHDLVTALDGIDPICPEDFDSPDQFNKKLRYFEIRNEGELAGETIRKIFDTKSALVSDADVAKFNMGYQTFYKQDHQLWLLSHQYIAVSKNSGLDWTLINSPNHLKSNVGWVLEDGDRKLLVTSDGVVEMRTGEHSWTNYTNENLAIEISYYDPRTQQLFAQSDSGAHISNDLGRTWKFVPGTKGLNYPTPYHSAERNWVMSETDGNLTLVWDEGDNWSQHTVVAKFEPAFTQCSNNACLIVNEQNFEKYSLQSDGSIKVVSAEVNAKDFEVLENISELYVSSDLAKVTGYDYEQGLFVKDNIAGSWDKIRHPIYADVIHSKSIFGDKSYLVASVTDSESTKNDKVYYTDLNKDQLSSLALPGSKNSNVLGAEEICWLDPENGILSFRRDYQRNGEYISEDVTYISEDGGKSWKLSNVEYAGTCLHFPDKILVGSTYVAK